MRQFNSIFPSQQLKSHDFDKNTSRFKLCLYWNKYNNIESSTHIFDSWTVNAFSRYTIHVLRGGQMLNRMSRAVSNRRNEQSLNETSKHFIFHTLSSNKIITEHFTISPTFILIWSNFELSEVVLKEEEKFFHLFSAQLSTSSTLFEFPALVHHRKYYDENVNFFFSSWNSQRRGGIDAIKIEKFHPSFAFRPWMDESEKKVSWTFSAFFQTLSRPFATEEYHISNQCIWWRRQSRPNEDSNELRCAGLCSFSIIHCLPPTSLRCHRHRQRLHYPIIAGHHHYSSFFFRPFFFEAATAAAESVAGDRSNLSAPHAKNGSQISQIIILYFRVITFCKFWGKPL